MLHEINSAVRSKEVTAVELVTRALERIEARNGAINAVISLHEGAVEEAAALDRRLSRGEEVGPLAGFPLLVKDLDDAKGLPTTYGSLLFSDADVAKEDSLVTSRLRAAGAIPIGKTNVPEFGSEGYTTNRLFGVTRNPWSPKWSPGGSSGGAAAALAAGMAPIVTASDGGGSIRIPAALCGLAGLKPSHGLIGRRPIPEWIDMTEHGPLATTMADIKLLLDIQAGPVAGDPTALPYRLPWTYEPPKRILASARFYDWGPLPDGVQHLFDHALGVLEEALGVPVEVIEPSSIFPRGNPDNDWWTIGGMEHLHSVTPEWLDEHWDSFDPAFQGFMEATRAIPFEEFMKARRRRFDYVLQLDQLLGGDSIIVTPTLAVEGWLAEGTLPGSDKGPDSDAYNVFVPNLCGHPSLSIPAGHCSNGLPFGIMLTGPRFRDDIVIAAGQAVEETAPWPLSAPDYDPFWTA